MRKVAMVAAFVMLSGCSTGSVAGTPVAENAGNELFEPCNVPEDLLREADVDPVNIQSNYFGEEDTEWDLCKWPGSWYFLTILSTTHTFDEIKSNPRSADFRQAAVGSRDAVTYHSTLYPDDRLCDVAFAWAKGSVIVSVDTKLGESAQDDPCNVAVRAANIFDGALPS